MMKVFWPLNSVLILLIFTFNASAQLNEANKFAVSLNVGHGTLDIALATSKVIVVATDSRKTFNDGTYEDNSKKLFIIENKRALAIAGLADSSIKGLPWLAVAPIIDESINFMNSKGFDDEYYWNDPSPPKDLHPEFRKYWGYDPYTWWNWLDGPIETIMNIIYTYDDRMDTERYQLIGILAGFKQNGDAKIEKLSLSPVKAKSNFNRPYIGTHKERVIQLLGNKPFISMTAGVTQLADLILDGPITNSLKLFAQKYPGIDAFLKRRGANSIAAIDEFEIIALAKDLIRATASQTPLVGSDPIQLAIIKSGKNVIYEAPNFPGPDNYLHVADEAWTYQLGVEFTSSYPFGDANKDRAPVSAKHKYHTLYTFCKIKENQNPIPLDDNYFYGCEFDKAKFKYSGGPVSFGENNTINESTLLLSPNLSESKLPTGLLNKFKSIKHSSN